MAEANISVNKQTVLQLLKSGQEVPFLIPEYQRPYSWSDDEIITLLLLGLHDKTNAFRG